MLPSIRGNAPSKVLLVDDDPVFQASLKILLDQFPTEWATHTANDVRSAVQLIANNHFDLAILDVHLPDGTAGDIIRNAGSLPCILCTQDNEEPTFKEIFSDTQISQNIVSYLIKPLQPGLIWTIRAGLEIAHERQLRNCLVAEATASLEEERNQIGQNLHDEMGAFLTQLSWLFSKINRAINVQGVDPLIIGQIEKMCSEGKNHVNAAYSMINEAITQLRPEAVCVAGLRVAIEYMLGNWKSAAPDVLFNFTCNADLEQVDSRRSGTIFRLIQEGLTNVMRHTQPISVDLNMSLKEHSEMVLTIKSVGGILIEKNTYKLSVLRERASSLGGTLQFSIHKSQQTTFLSISFPN